MDYFNQILRFSDGSIDREDEYQLFLQLSYDYELRAEFKKHLMISTSIKENIGNTNPPASAKAGIFGAIGLSLPEESLAGQITKGHKGMFNKYWMPILSGLITILLTSAFFLLYYIPEITYSSDNMTNSGFSAPIKHTSNFHLPQNIATINNEKSTKTIIKYKYIYIPVYAGLSKSTQEDNADIKSNSSIYPLLTTSRHDNCIAMNITKKQSIISNKQRNIFHSNEIDIYEPLGIGVEIFNSAVRHIPYPEVKPERYMNFTNMGIALYYNISDNFKIGADLRQETFHQVYEGNDKKYWQQPNFTTLCGFIRYSINDLGILHPFFQVDAGANYVGPVLRGQLGIEYSPYPSISFILGGEYSYLSFHHDSQYFGAHKLNFNYGVNLNF
jgi:hypothetical protein